MTMNSDIFHVDKPTFDYEPGPIIYYYLTEDLGSDYASWMDGIPDYIMCHPDMLPVIRAKFEKAGYILKPHSTTESTYPRIEHWRGCLTVKKYPLLSNIN